MQGLREIHHAVTTGDYSKLTIREVQIPDPSQYQPADVKALRSSMQVSQRLFASLVGVSPELVAHWEYGIRQPAPVARRLMDKIRENPAAFLKSLMQHKAAGM